MRRDESRYAAVLPIAAALGLSTVLLSFVVTVGADTMWLVALGTETCRLRSIPLGVPFAATDTTSWVNVPVLGELAFAGLDALGPGGLITAQLLAVALALWLVAISATRLGARPASAALTMIVILVGALPALGVVRAQMISLPLFVLLMLLLRSEHQHPTRRGWWIVPLIVLWGNLHGAVLVGVAVAGSYLLCSRALGHTRTALGAMGAMLAALWVTPGGMGTHEYYIGVMTNAAAHEGEGLWAPLGFSSAFDLLLMACGALFLGTALRRRLPLWEYVAIAGLLVMTVQASRHGVWLLLFLAPRSALAMTRPAAVVKDTASRRPRIAWAVPLALIIGCSILGLSKQADVVQRSSTSAADIVALIGADRSILAPSPLAESLAAAGGSIWAGNPIDAFPIRVQRAYLDFLRTQQLPPSDLPPPAVVIVRDPAGTATGEALAGYRLVARLEGYAIHVSDRP